MSQKNVEIIESLYRAFVQEDLQAVRDKMSPNIEWYEAENFPYEDGNPYLGPDAILDGVYARLAGEWDGFSEKIDNILDAGDKVVSIGYYSGIYKPTGKSVWAQFVHVWTLNDGIVTEFDQYTDTAQFRDALYD